MIWVVSHDSGGAEILSAWVRQNSDPSGYRFVLEGPAVNIFERKLGNKLTNWTRCDFEANLRVDDSVVTGSGWASDLEFFAINLAQSRNIFVATWLDHWVNYELRFKRNGTIVLPRQLWVSDNFQEAAARQLFPKVEIILRENPYFSEIRQEWLKLRPEPRESRKKSRYLFIGEALSDARPEFLGKPPETFPEVICLRRLIDQLLGIKGSFETTLRIRPHPSEKREKYESILKTFGGEWEWSTSSSLFEDCTWADEVFGISSMGLVIALLCGKKVTSVKIHENWTCPIPLKGIRSL